ncbi:MAG: aminotransferase class III-fold pyridoxal phosphate-dependent enzyme [Deltaproteobacteria bacterium]|jgi:taurine-pyruvate aminotransferase|nr:aminotransferase class III-fold pyridoxal phosphate-dependent enzyme [Deltaproteobacteria bacterium]
MYDTEQYLELDFKHVWRHLLRHTSNRPPVFAEAKGLRVTDLSGKVYLDATSGGVWCVNVGYGRETIVAKISEQLLKMPYFAGSFGNIPSAKYAQDLLKYTPHLSRIYFSNSGSEANEKAFKIVRLLAEVKGNSKFKILFRDRDYHGTTLGALSASGQWERKAGFGPFVPGFVELPHCNCYNCDFGPYPCSFKCVKKMEEIILREGPETIGAAIFETITAGGGILVPPREYYQEVAKLLKQYDILLILDEVVTGVGRTGKMFAYDHYGLKPDLVTLAKGVASGYMPISVTLATESIFSALQEGTDNFSYFRDISTFGGCAAAAAAALENLQIIEREDLLTRVREMGELLLSGLRQNLSHPHVGDVRGLGLLAGVELVESQESRKPLVEAKVTQIVSRMVELGVLVGRTNRSIPGRNNIINFAPAYIVTQEDLEIMLKTFAQALRDVL